MNKTKESRSSRAAEHVLDYDEWFITEVEKGLAAADLGDFTDHQAIRAMIDSRYPAQALKARNIPA